jgi:hypothetical protein
MFVVGILLLGLWITGEVTAHTLGGFIHVLLVLSFTVLLSQLIRGHRGSQLAELNTSSDAAEGNS